MSLGPHSRGLRRSVGVLALLLVAALLLPFVHIRWFHASIVDSISNALNRTVTVEAVSLRLLPQPGFDLHKFVVADDPSFSAEPMLRADDVTAYLRFSSLWRARPEIARLSLSEPSLNLVRRDDGIWNVYSLLQRAADTPSAPTGQTKPEGRPRFPYIEASSGRINFKIGQEKKFYALTDADFSLWLASEDKWGVRVSARPVRTDANLSDTGTLSLSGSFQRASSLRNTPLNLNLRLQNAQLGQLTKMMYGRDRGWRGAVTVAARLTGTPAELNVRSDAQVQDFRRYDIVTPTSLRLAMRCGARFSAADQSWSDVNCTAPISNGVVTITGRASDPLRSGPFSWQVTAQNVPMPAIVFAARHAKRDLPDDLISAGTLSAVFNFSRQAGSAPQWSGSGHTTGFRLGSPEKQTELGTVPFKIASRPIILSQDKRQDIFVSDEQQLVTLGPFAIEMDTLEPVTVRGWLTRSGYFLSLRGDARVERILQLAKNVGLHAVQPAAKGAAKLDLQVSGLWAGFALPEISGKAQLHDVSATMDGISAPLEIESANVLLTPGQSSVRHFVATFSGSDMHLSGWLDLPRRCTAIDGCSARVDLHADELDTATLGRLFNPRFLKRPWYRMLGPNQQSSFLARVNARGHITANRIIIGRTLANHCSADLVLDHGQLRLANLESEIWGGEHRAELQADFTGAEPAYDLRGTLDNAQLAPVTAPIADDWATGTISLRYRLTAVGWDRAGLLNSAAATAEFDLRNGVLQQISLAEGAPPLRVQRFTGHLNLHDGRFTVTAGKLQTPGGIYQVSGTALADKKVDIRLVRDGAHSFTITGTLESPKVVAVSGPQTQAALTK
ncbi:MAG TPA: AsmA family protein [Terriglobales bacterium]|nr:AsmA family protein [Terriglobales bacterium]